MRALSTSGSLLDGLKALPKRLTDGDLAAVQEVIDYDLPALPPCEEGVFEEELRMMSVLPRRRADDVSGPLMLAAYRQVLGDYPKQAIRYLRSHALRACKFMPSTAECVEIIQGWERRDARAKQLARSILAEETQHRMLETMNLLRERRLDQQEIDALPERWRAIAETKGYLRIVGRTEDDKPIYVARPSPALTACDAEGSE